MPEAPRDDLERELREALDAARSSDTRLHSIVDSAMDAIISVDGKQRITLFNRAAERIFGYEAREVLGEPLKMDLAYIEQKLTGADPEVHKTVEEMRRLLDITMAAARRISADLRPLLLDDLGLAAALEWLSKETARRHGFTVDLAVDDDCKQ